MQSNSCNCIAHTPDCFSAVRGSVGTPNIITFFSLFLYSLLSHRRHMQARRRRSIRGAVLPAPASGSGGPRLAARPPVRYTAQVQNTILGSSRKFRPKMTFSLVSLTTERFQLAFRTCKSLRETRLRDTFQALQVDGRTLPAQRLRSDILRLFVATSDTYPIAEIERQVLSLVCDTLREYKCLEGCAPLRRYVADVAKTAWFLVNHEPPFELDTDFQTPTRMQPERQVRHHTSDRNSETVRSYLWPGLIQDGQYMHKNVVITGGAS